MSNVNIRRAIENIRSSTTIYTPIVETVVNAIEAIEAANSGPSKVVVTVHRSPQNDFDNSESKILNITVRDNGIGFTNQNRDSFDTLYSDLKIKQGGKGFGRFTCLKYFEDLKIDSVYFDAGFKNRKFAMGKGQEIICDEIIAETDCRETGTTITLISEKTGSLHRKLATIARGLVDILLPYFITKDYNCPRIELTEADGSATIVLNEYLGSIGAVIQEIELEKDTFELASVVGLESFRVQVFKMLSPRNRLVK